MTGTSHDADFSRYGDHLLPVYARADIEIERGEGAWLIATSGKRYLDFSSGVAVVNLGHSHDACVAAAKAQIDKVWHTSNHFWTEPMVGLSRRLSERFGGGQVFFCNSGAEANEAAIKYARKSTGRSGIVSLERSFHGRTMGALSMTGQPKKRDGFAPLLPGITYVAAEDIDALTAAVTTDTAMVIMEPIQGEGGVIPLSQDYLAAARRVASDAGAHLCFDEIQGGIGRAGAFYSFQTYDDIAPDMITLAKAVSNGIPIGALIVSNTATGGFVVGDHATTFGGNPVACAAGCAVVDALTDDLLDSVRTKGERLMRSCAGLSRVIEARGRGLWIGLQVDEKPAEVVAACRDKGLIVTVAGSDVVRLTPPLIVSDAEIDRALEILGDVLN
jgi:acetylornithine/N-succinyldiaminopimelate aminotransferase